MSSYNGFRGRPVVPLRPPGAPDPTLVITDMAVVTVVTDAVVTVVTDAVVTVVTDAVVTVVTDAVAVAGLLESSLRLKPHEAQSFRRKALAVSWVSVVVTIALAIAAFTVSVLQHSASAFGFAVIRCDAGRFSSVIVLWRYSNAAAVHSASWGRSLFSYIVCVSGRVWCSGRSSLLSSFCIMGKAVYDLVSENPPELDDFLFSVSILSGVLCSVLAVVKIFLGRVLTSRALVTDGFNSLVGAVNKNHPDVWFLDGIFGVFIGLVILAYGRNYI
uniref:Uncharacterized protein n=1 Tax=Neogobius melanostomus TaxID=47308 RepID=A0A8C6SGG0_9GOBI